MHSLAATAFLRPIADEIGNFRRIPSSYLIPVAAFFIAEVLNRWVFGQKMAITFWFAQTLDPTALKTDLWRSLLLLHSEPPLFNLITGLMLKFASALDWRPETLADIIFGAFGLATGVTLFHLARRITNSMLAATAAVVLFYAEPSYYGGVSNAGVGRNFYFYEFPLQLVLLILSLSAWNWLRRANRWAGALLVASAVIVVNTRTLFNPLLWGVPVLFVVVIPQFKTHARQSIAMLFCGICLFTPWALKNYYYFGIATLSSLDGYNLSRDMAPPPKLLQNLNMNASLPPAAQFLPRFPRIMDFPPKSLEEVTSGTKSIGAPNWNNLVIVVTRQEAIRIGLAARRDIGAYWKHIVQMYKLATRAMYLHPYLWNAFGKTPPQFSGYLWFYDRLFYQNLPDSTAAHYWTPRLNVFAVFWLPALLIGVIAHLYYFKETRLWLALTAYTAFFPIIAASLSDGWEGNRMRHSTYPLMIMIAVILISSVCRRFELRRA